MQIEKGDTIEVKKGILDPESGEYELEGWKGEVIDKYEFKGDEIIEISWNIDTLNNMTEEFIKESVKDGYSFDEMHLSILDVIKIESKSDDKKERQSLVMKLERIYSNVGHDKQANRIAKILNNLSLNVDKENLEKFRKYLIENLKSRIILTGIEEFPWEEKYIFGYGSEREYKELKKENPSYKDHYKLLKILQVEEGEQDLYARVSRKSDLRKFELPLSDLKSLDTKNENYQLLDDFSVWIVNYQ